MPRLNTTAEAADQAGGERKAETGADFADPTVPLVERTAFENDGEVGVGEPGTTVAYLDDAVPRRQWTRAAYREHDRRASGYHTQGVFQ